jgi:hypothetical protein
MEASQNYTLTPNNFDLTSGAGLPAAFQSVIDLKIITPPGYGNTLFYMDPKEFDINYPTPVLFGLNRPYIFTKYGSLLMVFPTPDSAYVLTLRYYKTPVELVNTTDVPEIPVEWQELLVLGALWRCHQLNDNYDLAAIVQNRVDEQLTQYSQRMSLGKQQPSIMKLNSNTTARR